MGIKASVVDDVSLEDGLEYVQSNLSKIWIDQKNAAQLIKCLENYRYEYDAKKQIYKRTPIHNWASHGADAMRYLCLSLPKTQIGTTPEELDKRYREAYFGAESNSHLPSVFRDEVKDYR